MTDITNKINIQRLLRSINYNETNKVNITYNQILCEQLHKQNIELQNKSLSYCPPYHDGATCWPPILAGTTVHMPCPSSYEGQMYNPYENATKECLEHGNWSSKSDYIPCLLTGDSSTLDLTMILRCIFLTGYSLSCGCLCLALIIFYIFKSLKCMRNTIHSHLFVALMIKACAWSISYIFVEFADIKQFKDDTKLTISTLLNITISIQAFGSLAIFVWMFIEGLYLCLIVYCAFWVEKMQFWPYGLFGWGLPTVIVTVRIIINYVRYPTEFWLFYGTDVYLLTIPALILLGLNVIFLIIILYALNDKLRQHVIVTHNNEVNINNDICNLPLQALDKHRMSTDIYDRNYSLIGNSSILQSLSIRLHDDSVNNITSSSSLHCKQCKILSLHQKCITSDYNSNDLHEITTNNKQISSNNDNNNNSSKMNDIHIVHTQRRIHSLPNTRTSSTSSPISTNYDLQQNDCSFYSKLNNNLSHHHNRISRDASGRSSQISDISRFELPGTTRIRLAKLIGRISGREFVKTVKASLTLMPLLGIPEIIFITPYHPYLKPGFDIINAFLTSTQGIWVTLLYCFLTKEVRRQFTKRLKMRSLRTSLHPHRRSARMNKLSP